MGNTELGGGKSKNSKGKAMPNSETRPNPAGRQVRQVRRVISEEKESVIHASYTPGTGSRHTSL